MSDDEITEFIERSRTATMATVLADGRPHLVAMWYAVLDGEIWFETKAKSQKAVNLRRDPTITVMIEDGQSYTTLRGVSIDGQAEIIDDPETNLRVGISVWERYTGPVHRRDAPVRRSDDEQPDLCARGARPAAQLGSPQARHGRDARRRQHRRIPVGESMDPNNKPKQLNSPFVTTVMKYAGKAHVWVYRKSGGKIGANWRVGAGIEEAGAHVAARAHRSEVRQDVRLAAGVHQRRAGRRSWWRRRVVATPTRSGTATWWRSPTPTSRSARDRRAVRAEVAASPEEKDEALAEAGGGLRRLRHLSELGRPRDPRDRAQATLIARCDLSHSPECWLARCVG